MQDIPQPLKRIAERRIALNDFLGHLGAPYEEWIELTGGGVNSVLGYMLAGRPPTYGVADAASFHRWAKFFLRDTSTACPFKPNYGGARPVYLYRGGTVSGPDIVKLGMTQGHWIWRTRPCAEARDVITYPPIPSCDRSTGSSYEVDYTNAAPRTLIEVSVEVPAVAAATPQRTAPPVPITPSPQVQSVQSQPSSSTTPTQEAPLCALYRYLLGMPACYIIS